MPRIAGATRAQPPRAFSCGYLFPVEFSRTSTCVLLDPILGQRAGVEPAPEPTSYYLPAILIAWVPVLAVIIGLREFFPEDPADRRPDAWRAMLAAAAWRTGLFLALLAIWPVSKWLFALLKRLAHAKGIL